MQNPYEHAELPFSPPPSSATAAHCSADSARWCIALKARARHRCWHQTGWSWRCLRSCRAQSRPSAAPLLPAARVGSAAHRGNGMEKKKGGNGKWERGKRKGRRIWVETKHPQTHKHTNTHTHTQTHTHKHTHIHTHIHTNANEDMKQPSDGGKLSDLEKMTMGPPNNGEWA